MNEESSQLIFGIRAVIEAIQSEKEIDKILIQKGLSNELFGELKQALKGKDIPYQFVPVEKFRRLGNKNHQGLMAYLSGITYYKTEEILPQVFEKGEVPMIVMLDKITDVRNFGAIARSAECFGAHMIIVPSRGAAQINADAIKTSAGALHKIPVCREDNLKNTLDYLKESGLQIIACHEKTDKLISDINFKLPTTIIMGSEESGISGEYLKRSDFSAKIPMKGTIASFNVSVATGIVLYEAIRQRGL